MGKRKRETVYLSQLEGLQILWPGDVRALAEFVLRCYDAKDRAVDSSQSASRMESRPTVHGLAGHFAGIAGIPEVRIERQVRRARPFSGRNGGIRSVPAGWPINESEIDRPRKPGNSEQRWAFQRTTLPPQPMT